MDVCLLAGHSSCLLYLCQMVCVGCAKKHMHYWITVWLLVRLVNLYSSLAGTRSLKYIHDADQAKALASCGCYFLTCHQGALWMHDQHHALMMWSVLFFFLLFFLSASESFCRLSLFLFSCCLPSLPSHFNGSLWVFLLPFFCCTSTLLSVLLSIFIFLSSLFFPDACCALSISLSISFFSVGLMAEVHNKWEVYKCVFGNVEQAYQNRSLLCVCVFWVYSFTVGSVLCNKTILYANSYSLHGPLIVLHKVQIHTMKSCHSIVTALNIPKRTKTSEGGKDGVWVSVCFSCFIAVV